MHFFAFAAVLHTIIVAVVAFFVLFAASKADGFVRLLGNVLGWLLLIAAVLGLVVGIIHVATGKPMMGEDHHWMGEDHHWMMMHDDRGPQPLAVPAPPAAPAKTH